MKKTACPPEAPKDCALCPHLAANREGAVMKAPNRFNPA